MKRRTGRLFEAGFIVLTFVGVGLAGREGVEAFRENTAAAATEAMVPVYAAYGNQAAAESKQSEADMHSTNVDKDLLLVLGDLSCALAAVLMAAGVHAHTERQQDSAATSTSSISSVI